MWAGVGTSPFDSGLDMSGMGLFGILPIAYFRHLVRESVKFYDLMILVIAGNIYDVVLFQVLKTCLHASDVCCVKRPGLGKVWNHGHKPRASQPQDY